jgi:hypothetical protein
MMPDNCGLALIPRRARMAGQEEELQLRVVLDDQGVMLGF